MKKLLNAVTIIFCIFLTACTHSDNTAANPAVTEMSETHGNSAEVISSQAVQTTESDLQHSKVNFRNSKCYVCGRENENVIFI